MRTINRRIAKLENQFAPADGKRFLVVVSRAGWGHALDQDRCIQILRECGHLPTSYGFSLVNLGHIPDGLNADELEQYLREHGAELCPNSARPPLGGQPG